MLLSISVMVSGQQNFSGFFSNADYSASCTGRKSCSITFRFFENSTFTYIEHHFHYDAISSYYSHGQYSMKDDTIVLKSLLNDPCIKVLNGFSIEHKSAGVLSIMDDQWKDISGVKLFRENKLIRTDTILGHFSFFLNLNIRKRKKVSVEFEMPSNIKQHYTDSTLILPDRFSVFQKYKGITYPLGEVTDNDSLYVWDLDSSLIFVQTNTLSSYFGSDTILYSRNNIHCKFYYNNIKLPSPNQHFKCKPPYNLPVKIGNTRKDYVLERSKLSNNKCIKLLLRSDFFKNNRISFSDSLRIGFSVAQLFELMNRFGSNYISEILDDSLRPDIFFKSENNPAYIISNPAFTNDKVFAIVRVKKTGCDYDKYYFFERRRSHYILIGTLGEKIERVNLSMFIRL